VRIGQKKNYEKKQQQHAHRKSVVRLVDSENWSKKNKKNKTTTTFRSGLKKKTL